MSKTTDRAIAKLDKPVTHFVYASEHDEVLAQLMLARRRTEALAALVRQLAHTTPSKGECERTYAALQTRAPGTGGAWKR